MQKKNKNYTFKQITQKEQDSFVLMIGNDFYHKNNKYIFSQLQAEKHYENIMNSILYTLKNGNDKNKKNATKCLLRMHILPLKIH